jgi:hypothetical protein
VKYLYFIAFVPVISCSCQPHAKRPSSQTSTRSILHTSQYQPQFTTPSSSRPSFQAHTPPTPEIDPKSEHWSPAHQSDPHCDSFKEGRSLSKLLEEGGPKKRFSVHGYSKQILRIERTIDHHLRKHCIAVLFPPGTANSKNDPVHVAQTINPAWYRLIENTLARLPWTHLQLLQRIVIDNHPKEHGIAPFDRQDPNDGRDGHTIWLHEQLFRKPNHWAHGNFGSYWSYHTNLNRRTAAKQPSDHQLFSPILLHEIGHLVAYHLLPKGDKDDLAPPCAKMCGDLGGCKGLSPSQKELNCLSPYCMPFKVATGTENWAEQYRFFYQSSTTRSILQQTTGSCFKQLNDQKQGINGTFPPPWEQSLPDIITFRKSLWKSCKLKACKPF